MTGKANLSHWVLPSFAAVGDAGSGILYIRPDGADGAWAPPARVIYLTSLPCVGLRLRLASIGGHQSWHLIPEESSPSRLVAKWEAECSDAQEQWMKRKNEIYVYLYGFDCLVKAMFQRITKIIQN